jgi:hypothetical protein
MAKTIQEYENLIDAQIALKPDLNAVNGNASNVALFKGFRTAVAFVLNLFEQIYEDFKAYMEDLVNSKQYGTVTWWRNEVLKYQHGDLLLYLNNKFQYATVTPAKRVIKLVSVADKDRKVRLKIAGLDADGRPIKLSQEIVDGAQSYADEKRPAGTYPLCESYDPDLLKIQLKVFYNPQFGLIAVKAGVEAALLAYVNGIDFDAIFYNNKLVDAIQQLPYIINDQVFIIEIAAKPNGGVMAVVPSSYQAVAGYFLIDPDYPLANNIVYIPAV